MNDYYKILGIEKNASAEDVKKAYRRLAHQYHPDKRGGDEAKFKEINEAYQTLSDPQKRAHYDQFGSAPGGFGGRGFGGGRFDGFDFSQFGGDFRREGDFDFEDIFDLFGGAFGRRGPRQAQTESGRGRDLELNLEISFKEMARGVTKKLELSKEVTCETCNGSGVKTGSSSVDCTVCQGKGEIKETMGSFFGSFTRVYTCEACKGNGKVPKENCLACLGEGRKKTKKNIEITIPAGIRDGETLVVRNFGQAGFRNRRAGDLFIKLKIDNHPEFIRIGEDILFNLPLQLADALLGTTISVPTLDGERTIEIPAGTGDNAELRLKGYGIHGRKKGDQIIKVKLLMPRKLSNKAKKLVEELKKEL